MDKQGIYPHLDTTAAAIDVNRVRYDKLKEMQTNLSKLQSERKKLYKRYGNITSVLQNISIVLAAIAMVETTAGIATTVTVMGAPVGLALAGLGAVTGFLSAIFTPICKHLTKKKAKHAEKCGVYNAGIATLDSKFSEAINDGHISDKEYKGIVEDYNAILSQALNSNAQDMTNIREEAKKQVEEEIQKKLMKAVKSQ